MESTKKILLLLILLLTTFTLSGQTDDEFWFVAPAVSAEHWWNVSGSPTEPGAAPVSLKITTLDLPATVTITQPANEYDGTTNPDGFQEITVTIPANSSERVALWENDLTDPVNALMRKNVENKPAAQVLNKGLHIQSSSLITVYYEVEEYFNNDIFALKGKNALGDEFYCSFQDYKQNGEYDDLSASPPERTYSAIDMVAVEDGTTIWVYPSNTIEGHEGVAVGDSFSITLDKGETYSLVPDNYSKAPGNRLDGTRLRVEGSKRIAVTLKDDSVVSDGCKDLVGDQTIPLEAVDENGVREELVGMEYVVMKGDLRDNNDSWDRIYILGTQNSTNVRVTDVIAGTYTDKTIQAGETWRYRLSATEEVSYVNADKPVYVLHVTGSGGGCEIGGAILPSITRCTGSAQVGFSRSSRLNKDFLINIMIRDNGNGAKEAFELVNSNGDVIPLPAISWIEVKTNMWAATLDMTAEIQEQPISYILSNSIDIFHMGFLNAGSSNGGEYGYFSDYATVKADGGVIEELIQPGAKLCYGDSIQLIASGGVNYKWIPATYLDDPYSSNPVCRPKTTEKYQVVVYGASCAPPDTAEIIIQVSNPLEANFSVDITQGCAPIEVNVTNEAVGASDGYDWYFGDGTPVVNDSIPAPHLYRNKSDTAIDYTIKQIVYNEYCSRVLTREVRIYPEINADFTASDTAVCHSTLIDFTNNSSGNLDKYDWSFGDNGSSVEESPTHLYTNTGNKDSVYNVQLVAISPYYCRDTAFTSIRVHPVIEAHFATDHSVSCSPMDLTIDPKNSIGVDTFRWHFYNSPSTFDSTRITDSYSPMNMLYTDPTQETPDTIVVGLITANDEGCYDTVPDRKIVVYPEVHAQFNPSQTVVCDSVPINFSNSSVGYNLSYFWDFDDGTSSTTPSLNHTYYNRSDKDSIYNATLIARSEYLCRDTLSIPITVHPYVRSQFTVDHQNNCSPLLTTIYNSSVAPTGSVFDWDFGDGDMLNTGTRSDISHTYTNTLPDDDTTFTINLTVTTAQGCVSVMEKDLNVFPQVVPAFSLDRYEGCQPLQVEISNNSTGGSLTYDWDFGDNSSSSNSAATFNKLFENSTSNDVTYDILLTATNPYGCSDTTWQSVDVYAFIKANYNLANQDSCSPFPLGIDNQSQGGISQYHWNFDDGNISNDFEPPHTYGNTTDTVITRDLELVVENSQGCYDTLIRQVTVYPEVVADFVTSDGLYENCQPYPVDFINNSNIPATNFEWDFGDGFNSLAENPAAHTFKNSTAVDQTYPVTLVATSDYGCRDEITKDIIAYAFIESDFTVANADSCSPFPVLVDNQSTGGVAQYFWDFGDGSAINNNFEPDHTYTNTTDNVITRQLELVVKNNHACYDTVIKPVTVYPEVVADFVTSDGLYEDCQPFAVDFVNNSNIPATNFHWNFADGYESSSMDPDIHTFVNKTATDKTFPVTLVATSDYGCRDEVTKDIMAYAFIEPDFTVANADSCSPFPVLIDNQSEGGISQYFWNFDDGSAISNEFEPDHTYNNTSNNVITRDLELVVKNNHACYDTLIKPVTVYPEVVADFTTSDGQFEGCQPYVVDFVNNSNIPATHFQWSFDDGGNSANHTPKTHVFTNSGSIDSIYTVNLVATSDYGCRDEISRDIIAYSFIQSRFTVANQDSCSPFPVQIENLSTGGTDQFFWNFGDGSPVNNEYEPDHIYRNTTNSLMHPVLELVVKNQHACYDTFSHRLTVYPEVRASFRTQDGLYADCQPFGVQFVNESNAPAEYFIWDFDEGTHSVAEHPAKSFENLRPVDEVYDVNLYAESEYQCTDDTTINITAYAYTEAGFSVDDDEVCFGYPIEIENESSPGSVQFNWNMGNGTVRHDPGKFTYTWLNNTEGATYNLSLIARNLHGCADTASQPITVFPQVRARIALSDTMGCSPLNLDFYNVSQNVNSNDKFEWDFGYNTASSSSFEPHQHQFINPTKRDREYDIVLRAEERDNECFGYDTLTITVHANPDVSFEIANGFTKSCPIFPVDINNTTNPVLDYASTYHWSFGDDSSDLVLPNTNSVHHKYDNITDKNQNYHLKLIATSAMGCVDSAWQTITVHPRVMADYNVMGSTEACSPHILEFEENSIHEDRYEWSFGDGNISSDAFPSNRFVNHSDSIVVFPVTLKAISDFNCWDTITKNITLYPQPQALFYADPHTQFFPNSSVQIENRTNHAEMWNYEWDFGDQTNRELSYDPGQHTYGYWGDYNITMRVYSNYCADTITRAVSIYPALPVANFDSSYRGCVPLTVNFYDSSMYASVHTWDFDDGNTYKSGPGNNFESQLEPWGEVVEHTFTEAGLYNVILTVEGDGGYTQHNQIVEVYPSPEISFDVAPKTVMLPHEKIQTFNSTVAKPDYQWLWDFGDGSFSSDKEPSHLYKELGKYDVKLTVYTEHMCVDSLRIPQLVSVEGTGVLEFPNAFIPSLDGPNGGQYNLTDPLPDVFHPYHDGVVDYNLEIYTRWGELIFTSNDVNTGWDGYINGSLAKQDVYIWKAKGTYTNGSPFVKAGDVTLLVSPVSGE